MKDNEVEDKINGIGIGAPNGNYYTGTIEFAPNLPWKGIIPLARLFEERIGIPTALTNDANAAAIGEMTYGAARGMKNFIMNRLTNPVQVSLSMVRWCMVAMVSLVSWVT